MSLNGGLWNLRQTGWTTEYVTYTYSICLQEHSLCVLVFETSLLTVVTSPIIFLVSMKLRPRSLKGFNSQSSCLLCACSIAESGYSQSCGTSAWLEGKKEFPPGDGLNWWQQSGGFLMKRGAWAGRCGCVRAEDGAGSTDAPGSTSKGLQLLSFPVWSPLAAFSTENHCLWC